MKRRFTVSLTICGVLLAAACADSPTRIGFGPPSRIEVVSGGAQSQLAGYPLDQAVVLRVVDERGLPVAGVPLTVSTVTPAAQLFLDTKTTDQQGKLSFHWRLGAVLGQQVVRIEAPGVASGMSTQVSASATGSAVRAISGGSPGLCAVYSDGRIGCWKVDRGIPTAPPTVHPVETTLRFTSLTLITTPASDTPAKGCAIAESGRVWCFDLDQDHWTVDNMREVPGDYDNMQSLESARNGGTSSFGGGFCGLDREGHAWCWGENVHDRLGFPNIGPIPVATRVPIPGTLSTLSLALTHGCATQVDGRTWCWGSNATGELGRAGTDQDPIDLAPMPIDSPLRFERVLTIYLGSCGITVADVVYCWGRGIPASIRNTMTRAEREMPQQVLTGVSDIGVFPDAIFALQGGGVAEWWGDFDYLETGAGVPTPAKYPLPFTTFIARTAPDLSSPFMCGSSGTAGGTLCFISEMFVSYPDHVIDPDRLIAFGVPPLP
ncbi:MAG TPA: hypothetical protein VFN22_06495 [Gemmatimonadales bacterium]|nr:hypothetical protein [Gemmatimonadales bacterium]